MNRAACLVLLSIAACKQPEPSPKYRDALRAEANRAWMDLQLCLGGVAPLPPTGEAVVAELGRVARSRITPDTWPAPCKPYRNLLGSLLRAADETAAADAVNALDVAKITAPTWDALAGAIAAANLPTYGWKANERGVPVPQRPDVTILQYAELAEQAAPALREPGGPAPLIPGTRPPGSSEVACTSGDTEAFVTDDTFAIGTSRGGWVAIPFAQPFDHDKPLACGDGTAELVYAADGAAWRIACGRAGCTYEHAPLDGLVQDALLAGDQIVVALRGVGGRVRVLRAATLTELAAAATKDVVDAPNAKIHLRPLDGGAALVLEEGGKAKVVRITRDGQFLAM